MNKPNFWISNIIKWENQRYEGPASKTVYSSLVHRQEYLAFILNQIPEGSTVVEVGCGSGRLYEKLTNKSKLKYIGYDISAEAIELARQRSSRMNFSSHWICLPVNEIKGIQADYLITAGLLDWLQDDEIISLIGANRFKNQIHSFSLKTTSHQQTIHKLFSYIVSKLKTISYSPRAFKKDKILELLGTNDSWRFILHKKLSFGAFVHQLPDEIDDSFENFLVQRYFEGKPKKNGMVERIFKKVEIQCIKNYLNNLEKKKILEIGSGQGHYTQWILTQCPDKLICLDPSVNTQEYFSSSRYEFKKISLEKYNIEKNFEVVFALGVLEFVADVDQFIEKMIQISAPKALMVLLVPNEKRLSYFFYKLFHRAQAINLNTSLEKRVIKILKRKSIQLEIINCGLLNKLFVIKKNE